MSSPAHKTAKEDHYPFAVCCNSWFISAVFLRFSSMIRPHRLPGYYNESRDVSEPAPVPTYVRPPLAGGLSSANLEVRSHLRANRYVLPLRARKTDACATLVSSPVHSYTTS